jgi:putative addiction module component (TIGR02574 family)
MIAERFPELASLPLSEKRLLLNELCETIAMEDQESPDPKIVNLLEERWKAHQEDPSAAITLEEFRKRIGVAS